MTREEAQKIINAILKLRKEATDEQAVEIPNIYPLWREDVEYALEDRVRYNNILYKAITAHTSQSTWTPVDSPSLWTKVLTQEGQILPWEQPDSTNSYQIGDKVTYNGKTWVCAVANNVWKPGEYGWDEV